MKRRFQFGLARGLGAIAAVAIILGMAKSFPSTLSSSTVAMPGAVLNEIVFIAIGLSIAHAIGSRTRFDFALGFAAFATPHWLYFKPVEPRLMIPEETLWHHRVLFHWFNEAFADGIFDIDALGWQFNFRHTDVDLFLYTAETLVIGLLGGGYAAYLGRRARQRQAASN
jgi:hypothetical protein